MDTMHRMTIALADRFGDEWTNLARGDRAHVVRDFYDLVTGEYPDEEREAAAEYARRIGRGNLASYAACQRARFAREAR